MSPHVRGFITWGPRLIGVALTGFVALFALDSFDGRPIVEVLPDFAIHLIPAALVGLAVAVAWRFPWIGALAFAGLAAVYAAMVPQRPDWILVIAGPLALTAALFAVSGLFGKSGKPNQARPAG